MIFGYHVISYDAARILSRYGFVTPWPRQGRVRGRACLAAFPPWRGPYGLTPWGQAKGTTLTGHQPSFKRDRGIAAVFHAPSLVWSLVLAKASAGASSHVDCWCPDGIDPESKTKYERILSRAKSDGLGWRSQWPRGRCRRERWSRCRSRCCSCISAPQIRRMRGGCP